MDPWAFAMALGIVIFLWVMVSAFGVGGLDWVILEIHSSSNIL